MAGVIENYSKFEVRSVVRFLQAEGVGQSKSHRRLVNVYGRKVFSLKECLRGTFNLHTAERH
jgi:hypothetical protein